MVIRKQSRAVKVFKGIGSGRGVYSERDRMMEGNKRAQHDKDSKGRREKVYTLEGDGTFLYKNREMLRGEVSGKVWVLVGC